MSSPFLPSRFPIAPLLTAGLLLVATGCGGSANGEAQAGPGEPGASVGTGASQTPMPPRGSAWIIFGSDTVVAEVARSAEERSRGLMYRDEVPAGTGMLFVFEDVRTRSFWMKNTYVPLSIAFLDQNNAVVDIRHMEPEDEEFTRSSRAAMFALEVRQGWFEEQGIEVGDTAEIVFGPG